MKYQKSSASYVTNMHHIYSNCFTLSSSSAPCTSNWLRSSGIIGRSRVPLWIYRKIQSSDITDEKEETSFVNKIICISIISDILQIIDIIYINKKNQT